MYIYVYTSKINLLLLCYTDLYMVFPCSLVGKREHTRMDASFTLTTVRKSLFQNKSIKIRFRKKKLSEFLFLSDTKKTQWEDPRLQTAAITGPVSPLSNLVLEISPKA